VLFTSHRLPLNFEDASVEVLRLEDGTRTRLVTGAYAPLYLEGEDRKGYLIYSKEGNVLAQRFDAERGTTEGTASTLFEGVVSELTTGFSRISVSASGRLIYRPDSGRKAQIVWLEAGGEVTPVGEPGDFRDLSLSHDGSRFAYSARGRASIQDWRRLAVLPLHPSARAYGFTWTPDDRLLAVSTNDGIFVVRSDAAAAPASLIRGQQYLSPSSSVMAVGSSRTPAAVMLMSTLRSTCVVPV
jgi:hypothetical protein